MIEMKNIIYSVNEKLPKNYEHVIAICSATTFSGSFAMSGQYINGLFELDDPNLYGITDIEKSVYEADNIIITHWYSNVFKNDDMLICNGGIFKVN